MYKNQLQELAQRSCVNLPSYFCIREGPDHAPRFKAVVTFNGETFESPKFYNTLRQAEHAAAEVALGTLSGRGPSQSFAARIRDETAVCKNLLQETAQRAGVPLPLYTTTRSGSGHTPVFTCTVEVAGMTFSGEAAKLKKQAEKNAAMVAWSSLKQFGSQAGSTSRSSENDEIDEQEQTVIARILAARHTEKQGRVDPRSQGKHVSLSASRTGVLPNWEGSIQSVGDMVVPYNASGWVAVEFSGDAVQPQGVITTQQFNNPFRCRPYYPQFASHDGQASVVGCGHSFNILPSNSVISGNVCQLVPVQFGVTHLISQSRQQAPVPVEVHQRDEESFTNSGSSLSCRPRTIGNSLLGRPTSVNSSYNPTNWIYSAQWLAVHPNSVFITHPHSVRVPVSLPPPVRIRSAVPVSSAPPPQSRCEEHQNESTEERTTAGQVINESTEERTTAGQVINEMDSLRLE